MIIVDQKIADIKERKDYCPGLQAGPLSYSLSIEGGKTYLRCNQYIKMHFYLILKQSEIRFCVD